MYVLPPLVFQSVRRDCRLVNLVLPQCLLSWIFIVKAAAVVAQKVDSSCIQETQVQSLGWEVPLEKGTTIQSMARGTWRATVHQVAKSWTRLSD